MKIMGLLRNNINFDLHIGNEYPNCISFIHRKMVTIQLPSILTPIVH